MIWKKRTRKRSASVSAAMNWAIVMMVVFAIFTHITNSGDDLTIAVPEVAKDTTRETIATLKSFKNKILPTSLSLQDIKQGQGAPVICGQSVTIAYKAADSDGNPIEDSATANAPLTLTIGLKKAMPAFEEGLTGMRKGGVRNIVAPPFYAYGAEGFGRENVPLNDAITFEVEMLNASPTLPDPTETSYRFINARIGLGYSLACGKSASFNVTVWNIEGAKLYTSSGEDKSPLTLTPGSSEHFLGLENSLIGMKPGGVRTVIVPPAYQKRMNGGAEPLEIAFPKNQTVLVDIEALQ